MIKDNCIKKNIRKWGYKTYDENITDSLNKALKNFLKCHMKKQSGGRIVHSSEFYGVDSGKYSANTDSSSLSVTEDFIRPPLSANDPTGAIVGGAKKSFEICLKAVSEHASELGIELKNKEKKAMKEMFETKLTALMNSAKKQTQKDDHLDYKTFKNVLDQKRFAKLR